MHFSIRRPHAVAKSDSSNAPVGKHRQVCPKSLYSRSALQSWPAFMDWPHSSHTYPMLCVQAKAMPVTLLYKGHEGAHTGQWHCQWSQRW